MMTTTNKEEWEERFDDTFGRAIQLVGNNSPASEYVAAAVKDYIAALIKERETELLREVRVTIAKGNDPQWAIRAIAERRGLTL